MQTLRDILVNKSIDVLPIMDQIEKKSGIAMTMGIIPANMELYHKWKMSGDLVTPTVRAVGGSVIPTSINNTLQRTGLHEFTIFEQEDWSTIEELGKGDDVAAAMRYFATTFPGQLESMLQKIAKQMVCNWGMSEKVGPIALVKKQSQVFLGRDISQHDVISDSTANLIDSEIKRIITDAHKQSLEILTNKRKLLETLAEELLVKETLDAEEIFELSLPFISGTEKDIVEKQFMKIKVINEEIKQAEAQAKKEDAKEKAKEKRRLKAEQAKIEAEKQSQDQGQEEKATGSKKDKTKESEEKTEKQSNPKKK
jgi:hypothetical protein